MTPMVMTNTEIFELLTININGYIYLTINKVKHNVPKNYIK